MHSWSRYVFQPAKQFINRSDSVQTEHVRPILLVKPES